MGLVFRLVELLLIILPLAGAIVAAHRAFTAFRRGQQASGTEPDEKAAPASQAKTGNQAAQWAAIKRVVEEHRRTDSRWLDYELDAAKLLDFPLMTDMRNPFTTGFHKAKLRAEMLRPTRAEDLLDDREAADQYFAAVEEYVTAFNVAETEAIRQRRNEFTEEGQQRIARAQSLLRVVSDNAATAQERQRAFDLARKELDGLIVLPSLTQARIERGIAGELGG
ncbi:hypothetical protein A5791_00535 [Mycobacterium sp. 852002-51163_SCH5372311]|uniref:hypothetical protein n=1 Tax=Mycobacterium sp. 852002-51163_SCH5372311 TaxID=1834097 RepID=UPI0007FEF18F|nr:hypothetical protein [Mycobacterium sp. 852002-51163_SCH5372311]OBF79534.1 hypothetical protein A5791_00535 [Mycobacterium sp. 852002-51163_SCH5372311]